MGSRNDHRPCGAPLLLCEPLTCDAECTDQSYTAHWHWSQRPIASAPASLPLLGAPHCQHSCESKDFRVKSPTMRCYAIKSSLRGFVPGQKSSPKPSLRTGTQPGPPCKGRRRSGQEVILRETSRCDLTCASGSSRAYSARGGTVSTHFLSGVDDYPWRAAR